MISYILLVSGQGKVRLQKWFVTMPSRVKERITREVTQLVLARKPRQCNFLEYQDSRVIYRRYASLYLICAVTPGENELNALEIMHRYVESLDSHFGNVTELDIIFNYQIAYAILDELILAGELLEPSRHPVTCAVSLASQWEDWEGSHEVISALDGVGLGVDALGLNPPRCPKGC